MARHTTAALVLLVTGCADAELGRRVTVGEIAGTDAVLAMVERETSGLLYVCGGPDTMQSHTRWFDVRPDGAGLLGESEGWTVAATLDGDAWSGTLTDPDGASWDWSTAGSTDDVDGLYESDEGACRVGVVVQDGGGATQGVFCPTGTTAAQVVPVGNVVLEDGGLRMQADVEPPVEFLVTPIVP